LEVSGVEAVITLKKVGASYFSSVDKFTADEWKDMITKIANRTLAKNGWAVKEVTVK